MSEENEVQYEEASVLTMEAGEQTDDKYYNLPVLEDVDHPEIPREHEDGYYFRVLGGKGSPLGSKTDVEVVTASMADPDFSTLLIGKHGVGKDKLILHICAKTNRPVIRLVGNDDPDFIRLLVGSYSPTESGGFERKKGLLTLAIENGYTFVLDEFNTLSGTVQTTLNMILESSDQNQLTIPETNEVIEPHPEFNFVGTMNPNEVGYAGREMLDGATSSRFFPITIPELDSQSEKEVVSAETEWESDDEGLDMLLDEDGGVVTGIRGLHSMGKITTWVSTRDIIQIGRMSERLDSTRAATELVLVGRARPEDRDAIRTTINDQKW